MENEHVPVLLDETLEALSIKPDGVYIDGTFGRGGHSAKILEQLGPDGCLIGIDRDATAVACAQQRFGNDPRFQMFHTGFEALAEVAGEAGKMGEVDGILLDLGVSSPQLDEDERGFSFMRDGPLDMRMDQRESMTAADWLATASQEEIRDVLRRYGEERFAGRIATAIVTQRVEQPIVTTMQLAQLVEAAVPRKEKGKHPATRTFQALRIKLNRELEQVESALQQSLEVLKPGGRLVVISFHSLEDRLVKRFMRYQSTADHLPKGLPVSSEGMRAQMRLVGKPVAPGDDEIDRNPRARSSRLRVAERLAT
ncbi:16S rRNA (cytosine(1402)-N(4))-methyltransferase RsmH [Solemya elarraichensis gill symbiont]|uniref:Ribosomal RNA small subunit methyltransferase H n=1 Tax=Solemya elarraichensis gill symbiont TaxID=1918949 RepID=A0A1T2LD96_9GAMM|nr:16S rRNA (cytosine(1402)-N(4))-methyltransferase RsmH [Solemya elarraichensis gill symbiont]OOZ43059.1 16S rRNA (cytosine(1402)-N(4))-methyltransferase [Solemya elarraichensis gill symbiont]